MPRAAPYAASMQRSARLKLAIPLSVALFAIVALSSARRATDGAPGFPRMSLVELFTSQG